MWLMEGLNAVTGVTQRTEPDTQHATVSQGWAVAVYSATYKELSLFVLCPCYRRGTQCSRKLSNLLSWWVQTRTRARNWLDDEKVLHTLAPGGFAFLFLFLYSFVFYIVDVTSALFFSQISYNSWTKAGWREARVAGETSIVHCPLLARKWKLGGRGAGGTPHFSTLPPVGKWAKPEQLP